MTRHSPPCLSLSSSSSSRGFSLIEVMMSAVMVGIIGAGALSLVSHTSRSGADERKRALATADATATIDRIAQLVGVAGSHGGAPRLCELLEATGGPLAGGDSPIGFCPERSAANIPIASGLKRAVDIAAVDVDGVQAFRVTVTVTGPGLLNPAVVGTILPIAGAP